MVSDGSRKIGLSLSRDQSLHCWHTHTLGKKLSYLIYVLYVCFGSSLRQYFTYYTAYYLSSNARAIVYWK